MGRHPGEPPVVATKRALWQAGPASLERPKDGFSIRIPAAAPAPKPQDGAKDQRFVFDASQEKLDEGTTATATTTTTIVRRRRRIPTTTFHAAPKQRNPTTSACQSQAGGLEVFRLAAGNGIGGTTIVAQEDATEASTAPAHIVLGIAHVGRFLRVGKLLRVVFLRGRVDGKGVQGRGGPPRQQQQQHQQQQ